MVKEAVKDMQPVGRICERLRQYNLAGAIVGIMARQVAGVDGTSAETQVALVTCSAIIESLPVSFAAVMRRDERQSRLKLADKPRLGPILLKAAMVGAQRLFARSHVTRY